MYSSLNFHSETFSFALRKFGQIVGENFGVTKVIFVSSKKDLMLELETKSGKISPIESLSSTRTTFPLLSLGHLHLDLPAQHNQQLLEYVLQAFAQELELSVTRDRNKFLTAVLDNMNEGIIACDANGALTLFNKKTREIHGLGDNPDLSQDKWADYYGLYNPDLSPMKKDQVPLYRAFQGENFSNVEFVIARKGQSPISVLSHGKPMLDSDGRKFGAVTSMSDQTQMKTKLVTAESRFQTIFEQAPFSIQICNKEGKTLLVNPAWKALWLISDEIIENFILKDYNILEDKELINSGVIDYIRRGFAGEVTRIPIISYDPKTIGTDGAIRAVEGWIYPLKNAQGDVKEIVLIHIDVTAQQRAQKNERFLSQVSSILISSLDYQQTLHQIVDACVPIFADGCIIDLKEGESLKRVVTKHSSAETTKLLDELRTHYLPDANSPQPTGRVLRTGEPELLTVVDEKTVLARVLDKRHAELIQQIGIKSYIAVPMISRGQIIGVINLMKTSADYQFDDIDLSVAVEVAKQASLALENARLYQNAKDSIQKRDEFISIASHELKTPLTSMKLQIHLAQLNATESENGMIEAKYLKKVTDSATKQINRITFLVEDMLDISRISSGKLELNLEKANLTQLVQDVLDRYSSQFDQGNIQLSTRLESKVEVQCDTFRIEQVLINLITNAIRYGQGKPIEVSLEQKNDSALIQVTDHGLGIAPEDQQRIFERFERVVSRSNISGLGLGLFICKQIVDQHHGTITVNSRLGMGSTFSVVLPK